MTKVFAISILTCLFSQSVFGQGYQVLDDDPSKLIKGHLALEYLTVDAGLSNVSGAYAWAIGANTYYPLLPSLGLEGSLRTPLLKLESSGGLAISAEAGASKTLFSKTKLKDELKVLMSFSQSRSLGGGTVTTRSSTLTMPGNVRTEVFVRGGGYYRNSSYEPDDAGVFSSITSITHTGGYVGIGLSKGTFFQFKSEATNESFALGNIFKFYADVLLLPTNIEDPVYDDSDAIGWRVGVKWYNSPYTAENNFGRKKGFFGNMFAIGEMGTRPYEGAVITLSVGYVIMKF
ncbi:hypothetical protein [uncultured Roseivirga sp.]|uniref:hypothetical protein n=1 Tax=uncultured Roseivirga sp. TaxID=543088 RepID=UPI0030DB467E|tara:strand:- start:2029 stop:2895 length:867 start_codon:yes stop_codon:yes gene_type:complete